ncbi:hypothetical protein [Oceanirhabdus sp. W0125-5]|uniref:hypothetical protein n=1 Tax=Oceanirhabdus sp. W0125-5 TaxID=2999116 RepID=UPI0022F2D9B9|nr:hypothetical protein [Oceanirhabdus sp. W0125-5]WBW95691.1 hypothetical protein OW730_18605 [Oceanirhabdus sp. W0125-5]
MKNKLAFIMIIIIFVLSGCDTYSRVGGKHLHLQSNNKELFWFNGIHCNDPEHRMFDDIKKEFSSFNPDLVLVEGGANKQSYSSEKNAILHGGEPAFVSYISREKHIKIENIEPSNSKTFKYLLSKYDHDDVLAMLILRQINQTQREAKNTEIDFEKYYISFLNHLVEEGFPLEKEIQDIEDISNFLSPYIGFKLTNNTWGKIKAKKIVYFDDGTVHDIWKDTIIFRDDHVVKLIESKLKEYDKIFVMMGFDHAKNQQKRLKSIFDALNPSKE